MHATRLDPASVALVAQIDRSEHVDAEYEVVDGVLTERPVTVSEIPDWDPVGTGDFSVAAHIQACSRILAEGGVLLGVMDGPAPRGLAIVRPDFEPPLAWLAFLHVSRPHRRQGVASALWTAAVDVSVAAGATSLYVSAIPTGSALGFYFAQGCRLADPVHPVLFAAEPDDIHLTCPLRGSPAPPGAP